MNTLPFQQRRQRLLDKMLPDSAAIIFASPERQRNASCYYHYRQNSDFWYLTGFNEPDAILILLKTKNSHQSVLFNRKKDALAEIWYGRRLGQQEAIDTLKFDVAYSIEEITEQLPVLLNGLHVVYHNQGEDNDTDHIVFSAINTLRKGNRKHLQAPDTIIDWRPILHEMRLFKQPEEIELMKKAADITIKAHHRAMRHCRPGLYEYHLESEILHEFFNHGARFPAYNSIVGSGENGCILHYIDNNSLLKSGDLVLIDAGCEYEGYASDITRTFPVNGTFSSEQKAIYELVLAAQSAAILQIKPGNTLSQATDAAIYVMVNGLVKLGIMQGEVEKLIEEKAYTSYFMHGIGHWLGLDVHDVGAYVTELKDRTLQPGMVLTIEPGLYLSATADIPTQYRSIGIRIEDNLLVTETGHEVLTAGVAKLPEEIEAIMSGENKPS